MTDLRDDLQHRFDQIDEAVGRRCQEALVAVFRENRAPTGLFHTLMSQQLLLFLAGRLHAERGYPMPTWSRMGPSAPTSFPTTCPGGLGEAEVVPGLVELEVAVPHLRLAEWWGLGCSAKSTTRKGTTVTKRYQTKTSDTSALAVPEQVSVSMSEIAADMQEGLLALAVGAGLQVMGALMDADVAALTGPRGRHDLDRTAVRHGTEAGSVTLGGRRVGVRRPAGAGGGGLG